MKLFICFLFLISNSAYAEYFDIKPKLIQAIENLSGYKDIAFKGHQFSVPNEYTTELLYDTDIVIKNKGDGIFFITHPNRENFENNREELIRQLKLPARFEHAKDVHLYEKDGFYFLHEEFKKDFVADSSVKSTITISSPKNDDYFYMTFLVDNKNLTMNVIKSFRVE
jgi:acid phosphatase class B